MTPEIIKNQNVDMLNHYESFRVTAFNAKNQTIDTFDIKGTTSRVALKPHMSDIFRWVLNNRFDKIVMIHNHPSGDVMPSSADDTLTEEFNKLFNTFDIKLLDHIIITDSDYNSYKEECLILN